MIIKKVVVKHTVCSILMSTGPLFNWLPTCVWHRDISAAVDDLLLTVHEEQISMMMMLSLHLSAACETAFDLFANHSVAGHGYFRVALFPACGVISVGYVG